MKPNKDKPRMKKYTIKDFDTVFPNDGACLEYLKLKRYPDGIFCKKCERITSHHKVISRKSYSCGVCGHHVHPTAGTIYHKSSTPLTDWFYAVFLMASTRCGISSKQLERELGVTYKTAWRMFQKIREMLDESDLKLGTAVEVDETYIGGYKRGGGTGRGASHKKIVVGAVERDGSVKTKVIKDVSAATLTGFIRENVEPASMIYTDEWRSYRTLKDQGFGHERCHHNTKAYVIGDAHTNSIEGFWSLLKGGLRGVYKGRATAKYLQNYINEFAFRYNRRNDEQPMFISFLNQVSQSVD